MGDAAEIAVRVLTTIALAGLLLGAGLQLQWREVTGALAKSKMGRILTVNFLAVPALAAILVWWLQISKEVAAGIILLGASPFAPVVPTFARMAKVDLALAAALTGVFPVLSAFLTPAICAVSMHLHFDAISALVALVSTITLPLGLGVALNHFAPKVSRWLIKPVQVISEGVGAAGLALVLIAKYQMILGLGWKALLGVALLSELAFVAGWLCGTNRSDRMVIGLGSANRNIALALLIATHNFPGSATVAAVAGCGLVLILLGLAHVAVARFGFSSRAA